MYIGIILLISIFIGIKKSFRFNFKVRCRLISVTLILTLLVLIVSGLNVKYDGDSKSNYLPGIFKSDSERYLKETKMFKNDLLRVNELDGEFGSYYKVTPKMGLSSLIAWFSCGLDFDSDYWYYFISNFLFLILCIINSYVLFKIFDCLKIPNLLYLPLALFVILFSFDLYWILRFLREPIANSTFLFFLLVSMYHVLTGKNYNIYLFLSFFLMLLFRSQLALLSAATFLLISFFCRFNKTDFIIAVILFIIGIKQVILSAGMGTIDDILSAFKVSFLKEYIKIIFVSSNIILVFILFLIVLLSYVLHKKYVSSYKLGRLKLVISFFLFSGFVIYLSLPNMQIRFIFPFIFYAKLLFLFYCVDVVKYFRKYKFIISRK